MTRCLVHFGVDTCFRLPVLRRAGFEIAECDSLEMLSRALALHPDAVVMEEDPAAITERVIALTRSQSGVPLILFAAEPRLTKAAVDLIIPAFTTPDLWLEEIRVLITRTRAMVQTEAIESKPAAWPSGSAVIEISREEAERSAQEKKAPGSQRIEIRRQSNA